jgi:hypothetical protein
MRGTPAVGEARAVGDGDGEETSSEPAVKVPGPGVPEPRLTCAALGQGLIASDRPEALRASALAVGP